MSCWISVFDKMPAVSMRVIATGGQFVGEAYYHHKDGWLSQHGMPWVVISGETVTHWMPMPKTVEQCKGDLSWAAMCITNLIEHFDELGFNQAHKDALEMALELMREREGAL